MEFQNHYLGLSPRFVAAAGIEAATIDTDLPGYRPEWKVINLAMEIAGPAPAMAPSARFR